MKTCMCKLITKIQGYERYQNTMVKIVRSIVEGDDVSYSEVSPMYLVMLYDGRNITVFKDELAEA